MPLCRRGNGLAWDCWEAFGVTQPGSGDAQRLTPDPCSLPGTALCLGPCRQRWAIPGLLSSCLLSNSGILKKAASTVGEGSCWSQPMPPG